MHQLEPRVTKYSNLYQKLLNRSSILFYYCPIAEKAGKAGFLGAPSSSVTFTFNTHVRGRALQANPLSAPGETLMRC